MSCAVVVAHRRDPNARLTPSRAGSKQPPRVPPRPRAAGAAAPPTPRHPRSVAWPWPLPLPSGTRGREHVARPATSPQRVSPEGSVWSRACLDRGIEGVSVGVFTRKREREAPSLASFCAHGKQREAPHDAADAVFSVLPRGHQELSGVLGGSEGPSHPRWLTRPGPSVQARVLVVHSRGL